MEETEGSDFFFISAAGSQRMAYLSLLPDYVIIFEVNEIVRISEEWGNPLFSLWYTRILGI
ncbi:hypothetical protein GCM10008014_33580 [Paenibacillus silvae]|uniref:Uncharacterized protein n=1 Tax=Paenibacillus silvae TaxID=1325358 RepID=A0ABQ1ZG40_9BACL|nr:hypothetical protein GCM10008014_33580 [Paenibacillus silvae]